MTWISTKARFMPHAISDAEWDTYSSVQKLENFDFCLYRFNTDDVYSYNKAALGEGTTIRFRNGDSITVTMLIEEVDRYFGLNHGENILQKIKEDPL